MPPWGAGSKPKKTPANTVKNSTYSTGNRFGGPPGTTTPGGPPGSGRASQISRPAMAAAATAKRPQPNYGPPGTVTPGGPPGTGGARDQLLAMRDAMHQQPRPTGPYDIHLSPAAVDRRATTPPSNTADRNMIAQANRAGAGSYDRTVFSPQELMSAATSGAATAPAAQAVQQAAPPTPNELMGLRYTAAAEAYKDPATYAKSQATAPSPNELAGMRYQRAAETYTADPAAYAKAQAAPTFGTTGAMGWQPSQQELMRAATSGAATAPAASRVAQTAPSPSFSQEELMRAATSGAATHPAAQAVQQAAPVPTPMPTVAVGPSANQLVQGSQGAAAPAPAPVPAPAPAPAPAWDPANNDAPITGPVGMWTDPTNGGQMPDPADADAWQAMQDAVDSEFGPNQSIYNPTYDTERFSTYDPSAPPAWGGGYGNTGGGAGAGLGTFDPFTGEYLQFGSELSGIESQRGMIDEADAFWDLAHQRKWDEANRGIPGIFNSRGMLDSGLLPRAQAFSAADQNYEQSVQDWQVANQKAALDAQQAAAERRLTAARSGAVFDPWTSGYGVGR